MGGVIAGNLVTFVARCAFGAWLRERMARQELEVVVTEKMEALCPRRRIGKLPLSPLVKRSRRTGPVGFNIFALHGVHCSPFPAPSPQAALISKIIDSACDSPSWLRKNSI